MSGMCLTTTASVTSSRALRTSVVGSREEEPFREDEPHDQEAQRWEEVALLLTSG